MQAKNNLTIKDFVLHVSTTSMGHHFSHLFDDGNEICLESCMSGYCVAIYDNRQELIGTKTCTKLTDDYRVPFGTQIGDVVAITAALEVANKKMKEMYVLLD